MAKEIQVFVSVSYEMVSVAKGRAINKERVHFNQMLTLTLEDIEMVKCCSGDTMHGHFSNRLDEMARMQFIDRIRADAVLRREVGGVRWKPAQVGELVIGTTEAAALDFVRRRYVQSQQELGAFTYNYLSYVVDDLERAVHAREREATLAYTGF